MIMGSSSLNNYHIMLERLFTVFLFLETVDHVVHVQYFCWDAVVCCVAIHHSDDVFLLSFPVSSMGFAFVRSEMVLLCVSTWPGWRERWPRDNSTK